MRPLVSHRHFRRVFEEVFCAGDLARPLPSFDDTAPAEQIKAIMEAKGFEVAGVRTGGVVSGFVEQADLADGDVGDCCRPFDASLVVADSLPLAPLVLKLNEHPRLFITMWGEVGGVVERIDMQSPAARMWLFGMVTLLELRFSSLIEQHCPGDAWRAFLSAGRVQKAEELLAERSRRNQQLTAADCLQFSDKAQIIARNEQLRNLTRFTSRRQVEEVGKRLEKLRNNLAHAQDIIVNDWETIVALAENLDSVLDGPPGMRNGPV